MEQEHRITYKAGITRTPSDFLCTDGELAECINLTTDNEELKPVVQPARTMIYGTPSGLHWPTNAANKLLYIHKFNDSKRYIIAFCMSPGHSPWYLKWTTDGTTINDFIDDDGYPIGFGDSDISVTSIGKTLIVSDGNGLHYFLWNVGGVLYKFIGNNIPDIKASAYLYRSESTSYHYSVTNSQDFTGIIKRDNLHGLIIDPECPIDKYNDYIIGLYSKNKKSIADKKGFCEPFFIRFALELYDGNYIFITNPILLLPSVKGNTTLSYWGGTYEKISAITYFCALYILQETDYTGFEDIVKDVVVFATDGISLYDTTIDQELTSFREGFVNFAGFFRGNVSGQGGTVDEEQSVFQYIESEYKCLVERQQSDVVNDIKSASVFYKIASLGLKPFSGNLSEKINEHVLTNITTQEFLNYDDYYSRCNLSAKFLYTYNSRLNIANVSRSFFNGYDFFMVCDDRIASSYDFYVTIDTDYEPVVVHHHIDNCYQKQGYYFFYPDARARFVVIKQNGDIILNAKLTQHTGFHGSFYFAGLPGENMPERDTDADGSTSVTSPEPKEHLYNYIIQSEVNNPWVFQAQGYFKVGTGKIIGMSTITQALSQGQYGQYPLLVFSESGIWALSVASTGYYSSISPMSREICINPSSILQTDGAVFFVSKKGLMVVVGNEVKCVSEMMNGKTFNTSTLSPLATGTDWAGIVSACQGERTFLDYIRDEDCMMAYDYIDSRILIINPDFNFAFAYNMADGTISKVILPISVTNTVNDYPDYLLQGQQQISNATKNVLYSFYNKPREEEVTSRQTAFLLTRPMKLAGPVSQASLRQLMNVGTWDPGTAQTPLSSVKTEIYVSSDMRNWYNDISRFGAAARYYRLALYIKMLPIERLSGTIITTQERRNNNMR